jgi:hypothetical protein
MFAQRREDCFGPGFLYLRQTKTKYYYTSIAHEGQLKAILI